MQRRDRVLRPGCAPQKCINAAPAGDTSRTLVNYPPQPQPFLSLFIPHRVNGRDAGTMRCPPGLILRSIAGLSAVTQAAAVPNNTGSCRKTEVAILGAGVAGLTSAQALHNASISDFLIIERNDYIGGRAQHSTFGKQADGSRYTVELGANWVQGLNQPQGPENPIWSLAQKHGLRTGFSDYDSILTYDEDGYNDYADLIDEFDEAYASAEAYSGELLRENRPDVSARTGLALGGWRPEPSDARRQAVEWWRWDFETAMPPESNSLLFAASADNFTFAGDEVVLNEFVVDEEGLNKIFVKEAAEFLEDDDPRLILNTAVRNISYSGDGVRVGMDDGSCVEAEHAICTLSVGVLQRDVVQFSPPLPQWKVEAIQGFRMNSYTKVFMQFNESFWDDDTQYFLYADPAARGWYPLFQSLNAPGFFEGSNIIFATVVGSQSYLVENQSDEETKAQMLDVLRTMFPDEEVPEPLDFMYPRWTTEE